MHIIACAPRVLVLALNQIYQKLRRKEVLLLLEIDLHDRKSSHRPPLVSIVSQVMYLSLRVLVKLLATIDVIACLLLYHRAHATHVARMCALLRTML